MQNKVKENQSQELRVEDFFDIDSLSKEDILSMAIDLRTRIPSSELDSDIMQTKENQMETNDTEEIRGPRCFICGHPVICGCDFSAEEYGCDPNEYDDSAIVSTWHCSYCGRSYEMFDPSIEEKELYQEYWNRENKDT